MARLPALYVSHDSPNLAITPHTAAYRFLAGLRNDLPRPEAVLVVSAHYATRVPAVATAAKPAMIYDFGGFDHKLYTFDYPPPGGPEGLPPPAPPLAAPRFARRACG